MATNFDDINDFYAYYNAKAESIVAKHVEDKKKSFTLLVKIYIPIAVVCIFLCIFIRSFLPLIPAILLIIFFYFKQKKKLSNSGSEEIIGKSIKFLGEDIEFQCSSRNSSNLKRISCFSKVNHEITSVYFQCGLGGGRYSFSFIHGSDSIILPFNNAFFSVLVVIIYAIVFAKLFMLIFFFDSHSVYFGLLVGIFAAYFHIGELGGITFRKKSYFKGLIISADFNTQFHGRTYVCSKYDNSGMPHHLDIMGDKALQPYELNDDQFEASTSVMVEASIFLTKEMIEAFKKIKTSFGVPVDFVFKDKNLSILVPGLEFQNTDVFRDDDPFSNVASIINDVMLLLQVMKGANLGHVFADK